VGDGQWPRFEGVDHGGELLHVLKIEVARVVQIDVGLPDAVDHQQVGTGPVGVGQQLCAAQIDGDLVGGQLVIGSCAHNY